MLYWLCFPKSNMGSWRSKRDSLHERYKRSRNVSSILYGSKLQVFWRSSRDVVLLWTYSASIFIAYFIKWMFISVSRKFSTDMRWTMENEHIYYRFTLNSYKLILMQNINQLLPFELHYVLQISYNCNLYLSYKIKKLKFNVKSSTG